MLRSLINRLLARAGLRVSRINDNGWSIHNVRKPGLEPATIFDIGVHSGTPELYAAFPETYYVLVDPLKENERHLKKILTQYRGEYLLEAAGATMGAATIYVEPSLVGRSSLLERTRFTTTGSDLEERSIPVTTLDEIVAKRGLSGPFGIKIDTEGFELEVIRGAQRTLRDSQFVIAEVSVSKRFESGYVFADMISEMAKHGFHLCDVLTVPRSHRTREAMFLDVMFRPATS